MVRAIAASSSNALPADAVLEVGTRLRALGFDAYAKGKASSSALVFATTHLARDPQALSGALRDLLGPVPFVGFVGTTAFHDVRLREKKPALVVLVLDGGAGHARTVALADHEDVGAALLADAGRGRVRFLSVGVDAGTPGPLLDFLPVLDESFVPLAGCLSLPPSGQRASVLADGADVGPAAAVLDVEGVQMLVGVAQAAKPLGPVRYVTAANANVIQELDGRPAFEALMSDLPATLRARIPQLGGSLCAGFGTEEGDTLLMRNVVGLDPSTGAVAVAGHAHVGAEIVFSLRDQQSARADLGELLDGMQDILADTRAPKGTPGMGPRPKAFVVFSCSGRDSSLFSVPNHDIQQILARFGTEVPVVGVAGGGEICTYGARSYLFGMSCVVAALY
jgi:small ligand-binding sensory domain FIST